MQPSLHKLNVLLARLQTDMGVQETIPNGATDFCTVEDNFTVDYKQDFGPQALAQGILGQPQSVKSIASCDVKVSLPTVPSLATIPNVNNFLLCSGFTQVEVAFPYIYKQSSDIVGACKDMTLWGYTGDKTNNSSLLTIVSSAMFDCKIVGELGKALMFEFTGKGAVKDYPKADSYPTGMPLLSSTVPAVIKATIMTVGSISFKILKFDLTFGNKVELVKDMSKLYGHSQATIVGREVKFTVQALQTSLGTAGTNPIEKMDGQTLGDFSIMITHSIYSTITIGSTSGMCSITGIKQAADAGLNVFDISGTFINNDTQISFYSP